MPYTTQTRSKDTRRRYKRRNQFKKTQSLSTAPKQEPKYTIDPSLTVGSLEWLNERAKQTMELTGCRGYTGRNRYQCGFDSFRTEAECVDNAQQIRLIDNTIIGGGQSFQDSDWIMVHDDAQDKHMWVNRYRPDCEFPSGKIIEFATGEPVEFPLVSDADQDPSGYLGLHFARTANGESRVTDNKWRVYIKPNNRKKRYAMERMFKEQERLASAYYGQQDDSYLTDE